ncbi:MAG: flagellar biosynthetic protein FliQ [Planctomycetota bacterium]|nr:MAG: flagellar biosynthetic protein FliQ [Planctomycetota bacterium]
MTICEERKKEVTPVSDSQLVEFVRQAILSGLIVIAPVILMGFIIGTLMGLVQAATGIHEPVVGLVPRLLAMALVLVMVMPWMVERMVELLRTAAGGS